MNLLRGSSVFHSLRTVVLLAVLGGASAGCYTFVPSTASLLAPGKPVEFELNDLGRLNLADKIGPEVSRVTGILAQQTGTDYTLRVTQLTYLNGKSSNWIGEVVTVRQDFVKTVFERKFSSGKTTAAVLAGAGLVGGALVASLNASGDKTPGGDTKPPPPGTSYRGDH